MKGIFHNQYMCSRPNEGPSGIALLGCPLDITSSFRNGSEFGPESLRRASWTLETYSPYLDLDLSEIDFADAGDLELPPGNLVQSLDIIEEAVTSPAMLAQCVDKRTPVYVSFDMDVFDPSLAPGVTTPEPGRLMFKEVMDYLHVLREMDIMGADVVELAPVIRLSGE